MDHGSEAARPTTTTARSTELGVAPLAAGAVQGTEAANIGEAPLAAGFAAVARPNIGASRRQLGPVDLLRHGAGHGEAFVGHLPGSGVAVYGDYVYYALQPSPGAGRAVVPVDLLRHGAGHAETFVAQVPGGGVAAYGDYVFYALPRPGAGRAEVLVDLLRHGAGHGETFVRQLPGGGVTAYGDYAQYVLQPRPGAGRAVVLADVLPEYARHGEVLVGLLPGGGGGGLVHDGYGYFPWQPREVLPGSVGVVFNGSGNLARQTLPAPGTRGADGIAGALRGRNLGAGYDGSGDMADDLGAGYENRGMAAEHLRRLLAFAGIGACSVAVNGLAAGPGSPAVAFQLFVLLLGSLLLVILHVLRV